MKYDELLKKLYKKHPIDEMIKFNELNIQEELQNNDFLIVKYRDLYHKELDKLERLQEILERTSGERFKYYKFECNEKWERTEIEKFALPQDPQVIKIKKLIQKQNNIVRFFNMCYRAFQSRSWSMKNFLETL